MGSSSFLWRQLQISRGFVFASVPLYLGNVVVLALSFGTALPDGGGMAWAAISVLTGLGWLAVAWLIANPKAETLALAAFLGQAFFALALGGEYSWFLTHVFPLSTMMAQLTLAVFSTALVCLGTIALSTQPLSAGGWMVGVFTGLALTLAREPEWNFPGLWVFLLSLAVALILMVVLYHRVFLARLRAEVRATNQSELVSILLHEFEDGSQDWLWEADQDGRLRSVSKRLAHQLGRAPRELEDRSLVDVLIKDVSPLTVEDEEELAHLATLLAQKKPFREVEVPVQTGGQNRRWRLSAKPILDLAGVAVGWRGIGADVTEVQRLNNLNSRLVLLDSLTGLANRHRFEAVLHDLHSPRDVSKACGLILIDLQNFRMVNEGMGHEVGDKLLKEVAQRLRTRVPSSTLLARLGGDEFAVVVPGGEAEILEGIAEALRTTSDDPFLLDGHRLEVNFQVGIASSPKDASTATELFKCAELALHQSKQSHHGQTVRYQKELGEAAHQRLKLQSELKIALTQGQFELHYQPQIRLSDGAIIGWEALVRWKHPTWGMVSPADFIPTLEETGLIVPVGVWILETACREALTWPQDQKVAVNVSAVQFASRTFLESVRGVLAATKYPPARLELEITESVMAQDPHQVVQILQELRAEGIGVSLDDFGTGYSSLSYLRSLPLDKLKVDQSFIRVLGKDPNAAAIVQTVLSLSRQLGLKTTAEGVETPEQRDQLRAMGCENVQGYLYARPIPGPELPRFLQTFVTPS